MKWWKRIAAVLGIIVCFLVAWVTLAAVVYSPEYVLRVLLNGESDVELYVDGLPTRPIEAPSTPFIFETQVSSTAEDDLAAAFGVDDLGTFLTGTATQALIVIKDDAVVYEGYFNGTDRATMVTSFSVAKSFVSALVGIAIDEGHISDVDDPITDYLPELAERDPGFADVTIRHLLLMASGLDYQELRWFLFNGDDPLTTYYPDQREISLTNTNIVEPPGNHFNYNKYHPQLLGMILERTTGMSVTDFTRSRLWEPLGMEYDGAWALDSVESGFEKMEAGLNAPAIDFAKFGRLYLRGGDWDGQQIISTSWIDESTGLDPATHDAEYYSQSFGPYVYDDGRGYYGFMWYGKLRDGLPADIIAEGDRGQIIYVSPAHDAIIVRNGFEYGGISLGEWVDAMYDVVDDL